MQLVIASKNYSSWSMRPWVLMTHFGIPFEEILIALGRPETPDEIRRYSPTGKLPYLINGAMQVWDSLSIAETLAELYPEKALWPRDPLQRAYARSISAEMHSGFPALRTAMPMNIRGRTVLNDVSREALADIARIDAIWSDCLSRSGGPFLFGEFSIADAMFAPVVMRFNSYAPALSDVARSYAERVTALPAVQAWSAAARTEPGIAYYDAVL